MARHLSCHKNSELTLKSYASRLEVFNKFARALLYFRLEPCIFSAGLYTDQALVVLPLLLGKKHASTGLAKQWFIILLLLLRHMPASFLFVLSASE